MRTNHDRIARIMAPAVAAMDPADRIAHRAVLEKVIGRDGMVDPAAIPITIDHLHRVVYDAGIISTSSTSVYEDAIVSNDLDLPDYGTWQVDIDIGCLMAHSAGGDLDWRIFYNGTQVQSAVPTVATISSGGSYVRLAYTATGVDAGTPLDVRAQFKSNSAGTSSARRSVLRLDAYRTS